MADLPSFSTKEFYWLASCFCGIITCKLVYDITGFISPFCFKGYGKLSDKEKMEWNNRGFSTFHALIAAWASLYLLLFSDLFDEDSSNDLIVNRSSIISNMFLGFSIGYFLSDLAMVFWHFPALGGLEYVLGCCWSEKLYHLYLQWHCIVLWVVDCKDFSVHLFFCPHV
ncbi:hypothetical protein ERO13_D08G007500v2 [Gossypium hirsutum]|uniref:TLC domain-containing protein n=1 Tax=Gossypium barbadense TaxID=3634 RepID=A0A5J5Q7N3_GOSBA|nr:hypothetical protein ES319_D08G000300v1 [Gossypium barbadense]KAB2015079.1 hypothetical protein ES319_D08G000300v1 [Gossypium barbadense]KAG4132026.1 hypothetical protein ERO13_D08G007500v2 [Gossypium hirsutum]